MAVRPKEVLKAQGTYPLPNEPGRWNMPKVAGSVTIDAPIEKVFDSAADPQVIAQISSGALVGMTGEKGELGSYADWEYLKMRSRTTVSEVDRPSRLVQAMTGPMPGRWIWDLKQDGKAVRVDFCIEYSFLSGIPGKIVNRLLRGKMNRDMDKTMHGLKSHCEK